MAADASQRVQKAMENAFDEIDKTKVRRVQVSYKRARALQVLCEMIDLTLFCRNQDWQAFVIRIPVSRFKNTNPIHFAYLIRSSKWTSINRLNWDYLSPFQGELSWTRISPYDLREINLMLIHPRKLLVIGVEVIQVLLESSICRTRAIELL